MAYRLILILVLPILYQHVRAEQFCALESIAAVTGLERFEINENVVSDKHTGLMWRRCFEGMSGDNCEQGQPLQLSWPSALHHADTINKQNAYKPYKNWRLANVKELLSIGELQCVRPALDLNIFPNAPSGRTWSSSPYRFYPHYSWFVDFSELVSDHIARHEKNFILLVRDL